MRSNGIVKSRRFSVYRSLINRKKFQIEMTISIEYLNRCSFDKFYTQNYDMHDDIAKLLHVDVDTYIENARKYNAEVEYNKYLYREIMLWPTKKDAKKFIKEYIEARLIPMMIFLDE